MGDATISRVRLRDLARLGRFGPATAGGADLRRASAATPQTHQLAPRSRRSHGITHPATAFI